MINHNIGKAIFSGFEDPSEKVYYYFSLLENSQFNAKRLKISDVYQCNFINCNDKISKNKLYYS